MERLVPKRRNPNQVLDCIGSSNLLRARYNLVTNELQVDFLGGATYSYAGVTPAHWKGMKAADSKGTYLNREIKNNYPATKVL